jgi:ribonuclease HI
LEASLEVPSSPQSAFHTKTSSSTLLNPQHTYILQSKGYSKLNADGTGIGIVLKYQDSIQLTARQYFPSDRALSLAEYSALIVGLQYAVQLGLQHLILETDHIVLAKQLQGVFPMEKRIMKPLYWQVMHLIEERLQSFQVRIVPHVDEATELAKRALATNKSSLIPIKGDPMGDDFTGQGKQRKPSLPPVLIQTSQPQQQPSEANDEKEIMWQESDGSSHNDNPSKSNTNLTQDATTTTTIIDPQRTYLLQFDGGARGNPAGKSGCGMVLFDDQGHEVWCGWKYLKPMSNNMAEYHSILLGLLCAKSLGIQRIQAQGDSELVVKQLNGIYQVRDPKLKELWGPTRDVMQEFQTISVTHIAREYNKRADWLANHAMDTETSFGFEEH